MNCPCCKREPLIVLEHDEIEVDFCPACGGIWLDAGELELLFGNAEACRNFLSIGSPAKVPPGEKPRRCPICDKKMSKESTEGHPPVTFDNCPQGDGMWFDKGELAAVLSHGAAVASNTEVAAFLQSVFSE